MQNRRLYTSQPVNFAHPLNRGLASWWLNMPQRWGGSGTVFRDLAGRNHGTLMNMDASDWIGGGHRKGGYGALSLTGGTSDHIDTNVTDLNGQNLFAESDNPFTVSCWVRLQSGNTGTFIGKAGSTSANRTFHLGVDGSNFLFVRYRGANTVSSLLLDDGDWHHIVASYNGSTANLWSDAILINGGISPGATAEETSQRIIFGARTNGTGFFLTGDLDGIQVWGRGLARSEINALYQESLAGHPSTLNWMRRRVMAPSVISTQLLERSYPRGVNRGVLRGVA